MAKNIDHFLFFKSIVTTLSLGIDAICVYIQNYTKS